MAEGGLKVDRNPLTAEWENAKALTDKSQAQVNGRTVVTVEQTGERAILNWETFNVGRQTTVAFKQEASWAVLNRVNDPKARPSQIQGQIDAAGTVMVVNRNGIVFSGTSQVNTRNLVAAAVGMSDAQFRQGIYSAKVDSGVQERMTPAFGNDLAGAGDAATFSKATGDVRVEAGARIQTGKPESVTQGGGYVLLLGRRRTMPVRSRRRAARRCWPPETASSSARTGVRRQQHIDDPWQRGVRAPQGRQ